MRGNSAVWANRMSQLMPTTCYYYIEQHGKKNSDTETKNISNEEEKNTNVRREEASTDNTAQEVERNDTRRTGSNREEITRKIKKILRESSIKRTHTELVRGESGRVEQTETAEAFEERVRNDGYQYAVFGGTAVAFKIASESQWNENARVGRNTTKKKLSSVLPGKMLGGDEFKNKAGKLPSAQGRVWYEADINYTGGIRNRERIVYSNDGLIFATYDHYHTFYEILR